MLLPAALLLAITPGLDLLHHELLIQGRRRDRELTLHCELRFTAGGGSVGLRLHRDAELLAVRDQSGAALRYRRRKEDLEITPPLPLRPQEAQVWSFDYRFPLPRPLETIPGFFAAEPLYPTALLPAAAGEIPSADPTTSHIVFELPQPLLGIASGQVERRILDAGRIRSEWTQSYPSALHAFLISPLQEHILERGGRTYRAYLRPANRAQAAALLEHVAEVVELLNQKIGALPQTDFNVAEQDLVSGMKGFSVPGLTVLSSQEFLELPEFPYRILAHELSHAWWTFAIDPYGLADGLLREGLPTYTGILYAESRLGESGLRRELDNSKRIALLPRQPEPLARGFEMRNKNNTYPLIYHKGAYVLHMLRREIGDQKFELLLQTYFAAGRSQRPKLGDFERLAENIAGRSLRDFFGAWIDNAAIPRVRVEFRYDGGWLRGSLIEEEGQVHAVAVLRLTFADGSSRDVNLELAPGSQPFEIACERPPLRVEFDPAGDLLRR
jgi:hypothetical protein